MNVPDKSSLLFLLLLMIFSQCQMKKDAKKNRLEGEIVNDTIPGNVDCLLLESHIELEELVDVPIDEKLGDYSYSKEKSIHDYDTVQLNKEYGATFIFSKYLNTDPDSLFLMGEKFGIDSLFSSYYKNYEKSVKLLFAPPIFRHQVNGYDYLIVWGHPRIPSRTGSSYWVVAVTKNKKLINLFTFNDASTFFEYFGDYNNDGNLDFFYHKNPIHTAPLLAKNKLDWKSEEDTIHVYSFINEKLIQLDDYLVVLPDGKNRSAWWVQSYDSIDHKRSNWSLGWKRQDCLPHSQY